MTPHIIFIHGANATPKSFSYLEQLLPTHTREYLTYDASDNIGETIKHCAAKITQPCHLVGHSLGGVIAVSISQLLGPSKIMTVSTLSAPFGGSEVADRMSLLMPFNTFFRNIKTSNPIFRALRAIGPVAPTLNIITTGGHSPFEPKDNDGVVTVESQEALKGAYQVHVPFTHFEVLLDQGVADTISMFMKTQQVHP